MLQDFLSVFDHFGTLCIKVFNATQSEFKVNMKTPE